jgi:hypothetical protein
VIGRGGRGTPVSGLALAAALVAAVLCSGCAKTGDPHPPLLRVAKPASDLAARQRSDGILLRVTVPTAHTDGSPVTDLGTVEFLRYVEPRPGAGAAVTEEQFLASAVTVFRERGEALGGALQEGALSFLDPLDLPDPSDRFKTAFRYAVRFINRKNQTAGLSNQVVVAPIAIPPAPRSLSVERAQDYVRLRWSAAGPAGTAPIQPAPNAAPAYNVYRSEAGQAAPSRPLNREPLAATEFEDRAFEFDKTYQYRVTVVVPGTDPPAESTPSEPLEVRTKDEFPPGAPKDLNVVAEGGIVFLLWTAPPEPDVAGYRVYRRVNGGAPERLGPDLIPTPSFRDEKPFAGKRSSYRVTAVDRAGNEGPGADQDVDVP